MRGFEDDLRLITLKSIDGLGEKVNEHLKELCCSNRRSKISKWRRKNKNS